MFCYDSDDFWCLIFMLSYEPFCFPVFFRCCSISRSLGGFETLLPESKTWLVTYKPQKSSLSTLISFNAYSSHISFFINIFSETEIPGSAKAFHFSHRTHKVNEIHIMMIRSSNLPSRLSLSVITIDLHSLSHTHTHKLINGSKIDFQITNFAWAALFQNCLYS